MRPAIPLRSALGALALFFAGSAQAAPIEWPVFTGGNGHFYELKQPAGGINWTDAKAAAQASIWRGATGHLATVTSAAENSFLTSRLPAWAWIGLSDMASPGAY